MYCNQCTHYRKGYCSVKHKEVGYLQKFPCFEAVVEDDVVLLPEEKMNKPIFDTINTIEQMETKVCKTCGRELPIEDFATYKGAPTSICKDCKKKSLSEAGKKRHEKATEPVEEKVAAKTLKLEDIMIKEERPKLILTTSLEWTDVKEIVDIADALLESIDRKELLKVGQCGFYTEVLRRWCNERDERNESK